MPKRIVIEEFHLTLLVPQDLPAAEASAIRRTLIGAGFRKRLKRAVEALVRRYRSLGTTTVAVSR
jgi:hypothetical protein